MNAVDQIRYNMLRYTSIFNHPIDTIYHMMLCNGNVMNGVNRVS